MTDKLMKSAESPLEQLSVLNRRLLEFFGAAWNNDLAWRIVFSEDQFEKRLGTYSDFTESGIFIRNVTEVREVPKYRQWIHNKFVLERLVAVPDDNKSELLGVKVSYEPIYVFEDAHGNALPPKWEATKFIIDTLLAATSDKGSLGPKYRDPESDEKDPQVAIEARESRLDRIQEELFGNESYVGDALAHKQAVVVPCNFNKIN